MRILSLALVTLCATLGAARAQSTQTPTGPVEVIEHIDIQQPQTKAARTAIKTYQAAVRKEPGVASALAFDEIGRPSRFVLVQRWTDQAAYTASRTAAARTRFDHEIDLIDRAPIDERPQSDFLEQAGGAPASSTIFVLTHVDVTPPRRPQTEDALTKLAAASRSEPGAVTFDVFRQAGQANHFTLFEAWKSSKAFDAHGRAPATLEFRRTVAPLLGALYDERLYKQID